MSGLIRPSTALLWCQLLLSTSVKGFTPVASRRSTSLLAVRQSVVPVDSKPRLSSAAEWHHERRRQMLERYGNQIAPLERNASSQSLGLPLLFFANATLWTLAFLSGSLPIWAVVGLSIFPGSICSLWQLQILHDVIHGSFLRKRQNRFLGMSRKTLQDRLLFFGSMPCIFGYYLYLKYGHLTHHSNAGDHSLAQLFASDQADFEDGDVLFVAHRMHLKGDYGPSIPIPFTDRRVKLSISKSGFHFWREGATIRNTLLFATSFLYERLLLSVNDIFVALLGKNLYFPNKPDSFHADCAAYARFATLLRLGLWAVAGWKALLFLYLCEALWSIPPHPAAAMFITNHGSKSDNDVCIPTSSTYAGRWYSLLTLGTNYHCEHHDFPTIPFDQLYKLRSIAPEFYPAGSKDNLLVIMDLTMAHPEFYACMDTGVLVKGDHTAGSL